MSKKLKILLVLLFILFLSGVYTLTLSEKFNTPKIEEAFYSLNKPDAKIAHIKYLSSNKAIVYYETNSSEEERFGSVNFKKNRFYWDFVGGYDMTVSKNQTLQGSVGVLKHDFTGFNSEIGGRVYDSNVDKIKILTKSGLEYEAEIVEYGKNKRLWFFISEQESLLESTVSALSKDGKVIDKTTY